MKAKIAMVIIMVGLLACSIGSSVYAADERPVSTQIIILTTASNAVTAFAVPSVTSPMKLTKLDFWVEGNTLRWNVDSTPTVDLGIPIDAGDGMRISEPATMRDLLFIMKRGGTGTTVYGTFYAK